MPSPAENAERFKKRVRRFELTAERLERTFDSGSLTRRDLEALYEGLFLGAVVELETFLELLFTSIMLGRISYGGGRVVPRVEVRSSAVLADILHEGKRYIDWFPYSETETRAKSYLRGGRPFTLLTLSQKDSLQRWLWIRNAIAHSGKHAQDVFERNVIGPTPLPPRERTPAGFLRSEIRKGVSRFEHNLDEMKSVAVTLCG
jgi:hypothetical protein